LVPSIGRLPGRTDATAGGGHWTHPRSASSAGQTGAEGLDVEQLAGEANLQPRAGDKVTVGGQELVWQEHQANESFIAFNGYVGKRMEYSVAYAVCYLLSESERNDLQFKIGSDDQAKVYFNGREVYSYRATGPLVEDRDTVTPITLHRGANVLVFKVVNETAAWQGCIRLLDHTGHSVPTIRVRLTRER
jgi:hypothetical protein